jgi:prepilin peptidase CpaA
LRYWAGGTGACRFVVISMIWLAGLSLVVGVAASVEDLWRRRVSNVIALAAFVAGIIAHSILNGWQGAFDALIGSIFGFAVFLVFFLLGGMGGGDIKLMAGFGAIVGREQIWLAAVYTAMVGGLMALLYLLGKKIWVALRKPAPATQPVRKDSIPYAPAISLGVLLSFLSEESLWTSVS